MPRNIAANEIAKSGFSSGFILWSSDIALLYYIFNINDK